jgi:ribosomal protein L40E
MGTIVVASIFLVVLSMTADSVRSSGWKLKRHNRCEVCASRLKTVNGPYAIRCRKCGQVQSWSLKMLEGRATSGPLSDLT